MYYYIVIEEGQPTDIIKSECPLDYPEVLKEIDEEQYNIIEKSIRWVVPQ